MKKEREAVTAAVCPIPPLWRSGATVGSGTWTAGRACGAIGQAGLAGLAGLALCLPAHAQSRVAMYGAVDLGIEWKKAGERASMRMAPGGTLGSRIGFRGEEDLGGGYFARFKLETGFAADTGVLTQGGRGFGRGSNVELGHRRYGSVMLGRLELPYYQAHRLVDAFSWKTNGGLLSLNRSGSSVRQLVPLVISARADNAVAYVSPTLRGLEFRALVSAGEGSPTQRSAFSASVRYRHQGLDAVAGFARQQGAGAGSGAIDAYVVGGSYQFAAVRVFAGLTNEKNDCNTCAGTFKLGPDIAPAGASEFRFANLGAQMSFGALSVYTQVTRVSDRSDYLAATPNRDATWLALGGEYALSKRTSIYASLGSINNRNGSNYALGSGTSQQPANAVSPGNPRAYAAVVGMRHFF